MNEDWVNDWYLLGATTDVVDGTVSRRTVGQINLAVFSLHGEIFAVRDVCGDCSQSLAGGVARDNVVECPGCGQQLRFVLDAASSTDAGENCLSTYPVMLVNDEIFAWIEELS